MSTESASESDSASVVSYRIVEISQHLLGQLDTCIESYYRNTWPKELHDFTPVTTKLHQPEYQPLQMIRKCYSLVKPHSPHTSDLDILTAIVLYYYSTVVLEYYALLDAESQKVYLQKKYVSEDGQLLVTQDDQVFQVVIHQVTNKVMELKKVVLKNVLTEAPLQIAAIQEEAHRQATLSLLSASLRGECPAMSNMITQEVLPQRYFFRLNDPDGFILTPTNASCESFGKTPAMIRGFFRNFQNKEINQLLFHFTCSEEAWASQVRRICHGLTVTPS